MDQKLNLGKRILMPIKFIIIAINEKGKHFFLVSSRLTSTKLPLLFNIFSGVSR